MFTRSSGILLHISSLPGKQGIGSLGKEAFRFADFLSDAKQSLWQILPLCPMDSKNCPYVGLSAFAGNPLFVDLEIIAEEGLLNSSDIENLSFSDDKVDYALVNVAKMRLLKKSYASFINQKLFSETVFVTFCKNNAPWLDDFSLFMALLAQNNNLPWYKWKKELKFRNKEAIKTATIELESEIGFYKYLQFVFFKQWSVLKNM